MEQNYMNSVEVSNAVFQFHHSHFQHVNNISAVVATQRLFTFLSLRRWEMLVEMWIVYRITMCQALIDQMMGIGWDIWKIQWQIICHMLCQHKSPMSSHKGEHSRQQCYPFLVSNMLAPSQRFRKFYGE